MKSKWLKYTAQKSNCLQELQLFPNYPGKDVCESRHKGNPESQTAFQSIKDGLTEREEQVLRVIREYPESTAEEISDYMGVSVNTISGRCSALKFKGIIVKVGTRLTRSGCSAAILKAV